MYFDFSPTAEKGFKMNAKVTKPAGCYQCKIVIYNSGSTVLIKHREECRSNKQTLYDD